LALPALPSSAELTILSEPVEKLAKSQAYPYGLTPKKIVVLREAGMLTVGQLAETPDSELLALPGVGEATVARIHNVVGQAIWM
jgi:DNA-directed RNA polymerase alpha subunit